MPYLLHHLYKAGNFKLYRLVISFYKGKEPRKKEDWLDGIGGWPTSSFRDGFAGGSVKDNDSKAKFLEDVQVYLEYILRIVIY